MLMSRGLFRIGGVLAMLAMVLVVFHNEIARAAPRNLIIPNSGGTAAQSAFPSGRGVIYPQCVPGNNNMAAGGMMMGMMGMNGFAQATSLGTYPVGGVPVQSMCNQNNQNQNNLGIFPFLGCFGVCLLLFSPFLLAGGPVVGPVGGPVVGPLGGSAAALGVNGFYGGGL